MKPSLGIISADDLEQYAKIGLDRADWYEKALAEIIHVCRIESWDVVDFARMTFEEQLHVIVNTNLLIGFHGAGLTHLVWLPFPYQSHLIEFFYSTSLRYFQNLAVLSNGDHEFQVTVTDKLGKGVVDVDRLSRSMENALLKIHNRILGQCKI